LTRDPEKYKDKQVKGKVEFTSENPKQLISRLEKEGHKKVFLSVGAKVLSLFLKDQLVNEFILTLEPKIFGKGINMVEEGEFEVNLQLIEVNQLNDKGTLLLKYSVD